MNQDSFSDCRIFLRRMVVSCKIGVDRAEAHAPQMLLVDAEIIPARGAFCDYAAVRRRLRALAESKQHGLMEDFAREAAEMILAEFPAEKARIVCRKPRPFADVGEAGAEVEIRRGADSD